MLTRSDCVNQPEKKTDPPVKPIVATLEQSVRVTTRIVTRGDIRAVCRGTGIHENLHLFGQFVLPRNKLPVFQFGIFQVIEQQCYKATCGDHCGK